MSFLPWRFWRTKRGILILVSFLLLILFFVRPGVKALHNRITAEISLAVGRQVEISDATFRLLPRPGFDLNNFVVYDNPAFGAEPMLRSAQVTADLRFISLLRGRLEISRLKLNEPSLNLVRNSQGHWNLEDLLERNAQIPAAPTSKAKTERRPGFPYIEASQGRINCKLGQEKTPYSLTDADFSLWQDSENSWGMRLKAVPLRTDQNVSDTGLLTTEGTWQRSTALRETPLQFQLQWDRAQLGQFTKLIRGYDAGWRGTIRLNATLTGNPGNLHIASTASIRDFRRFDIVSGGELRLAASCTATYSSGDHSISDLDCHAPVGSGAISVNGNIANLAGMRRYDLNFAAQKLPMQSLVSLATHTRKNIPQDLRAEGTLDASFKLQPEDDRDGKIWQGEGSTNQLRFISSSANADFVLGNVPFSFAPSAQTQHKKSTATSAAAETRLNIGPFHISTGRPTPLSVQGWVSRTGYGFTLHGDTQPQQFLTVAQSVGFAVPKPGGNMKLKNMQIAGTWSEMQPQSSIKN